MDSTLLTEALPPTYVETLLSRIPERSADELSSQFTECLKYLAIISMTEGRRIPVTPEVDDIWHELIVQTQSYKRLCSKLPGRRFIHHESITPELYSERVGNRQFAAEFIAWVPDYVHSLGKFAETASAHWTFCKFLRESMSMSLDEIDVPGETAAPLAAIPKN